MDLSSKVKKSLKSLALARFFGQLVSWCITIYVIRILSPEDYGLMALAAIVIGVSDLFKEMGLGSAIVQKKHISLEDINKIFNLLLFINFGLYLLVYLLSPFFASFFEDERLTVILRIVGIQLPLYSFMVIPLAILTRRMEYGKKAIINFTKIICTSFTTLFFAINGMGVWSLVWGNLIGTCLEVICVNCFARYKYYPILSVFGLLDILKFGGHVTLGRFFWLLYVKSDVFLIGKFLGSNSLGIYTVALELATLPMQKISGIINDVGFSAFSTIQDEVNLFSKNFCRATSSLAVFSFPVFFGISCVSPRLVSLFLGDKWIEVVFPLQIIALIAPLQMLSGIFAPALMSKGRPDIGLINSLFACILMPITFYVGLHWGINGVAISWLLSFPFYFLFVLYRSLPILNVSFSSYFKSIWGAFYASLFMMFCLFFLGKIHYFNNVDSILNFSLFIFFGVISYVMIIYFMQKDTFNEFLALFK